MPLYVVVHAELNTGIRVVGVYRNWRVALEAAQEISPTIHTPVIEENTTWWYDEDEKQCFMEIKIF